MMKEIIRIDRDDCVLVAIDYQVKLLRPWKTARP